MKFFAAFRAIFAGLALALAAANAALAHESRPISVFISEPQENTYQVEWRIPGSLPPDQIPAIILPADCSRVGQQGPRAYEGRAFYRCPSPLSGRTIEIRYPDFNPSVSALFQLKTLKGENRTGLLEPRETQWRVPEAETKLGVARDYIELGVAHIWAGLDHLLFLVCLLWIAGSFKRILVTVTGFTLAHSLTIALSTLGLIHFPSPPVEAAIALSILFLTREIALGRRDTLTWKHPIAVSSSFGLLHGLGFAGVLGDIGLPQTELITGLIGFNVGVEIGQILFIAAIALLALAYKAAARRWLQDQPGALSILPKAQLAAIYGVGIISAYWFVERLSSFAS